MKERGWCWQLGAMRDKTATLCGIRAESLLRHEGFSFLCLEGGSCCPEGIADGTVCMDGDIRGYCSIWFRKRGHWFPNIKFEEGMVIQRKRYLDRLTSRIDNGMIKVITRVRGSGKSFLLFNLFYQF